MRGCAIFNAKGSGYENLKICQHKISSRVESRNKKICLFSYMFSENTIPLLKLRIEYAKG